jgi:amino acid permease
LARPFNWALNCLAYALGLQCILISGVIGTNIFNGVGEALRISGPLGLLVAMVFAGFVAICVGETISEMVQVFPVPNAAFNYVKYWLGDEDIAWAIGTLYWYAWATIFAQQMISAANLLGYWGPGRFWPCVTFYFLAPLALIMLNLFPVDVSAVFFLLLFIDRSGVSDIVLTRIALPCYV